MKKILAKSLVFIIEAGLEVLAERIKKRRTKNGNRDGMADLRDGNSAYGLHSRSAAHSFAAGGRRAVKKKRGRRRSISWERQNSKKGVRNDERTNHVPRR